MLSPHSQSLLAPLLPNTAFFGSSSQTIDPSHPSCSSSAIQQPPEIPPSYEILDPSVFTDPHFLAAAHTFQDHLYSGWLTEAHVAKVKQFEDGVRSGTLAAPWKDEVWDRDHPVLEEDDPQPSRSSLFNIGGVPVTNSIPASTMRAGLVSPPPSSLSQLTLTYLGTGRQRSSNC